jgi:hypothetical protein
MAISLGDITLPAQTLWVDRFAATQAAQTVDYTLGGNAVVWWTPQAGRVITLEFGETTAWLSRDTVEALWALAAAGGVVPFQFDERLRQAAGGVEDAVRGYTADVMFAHHLAPAIDLRALEPLLDQYIGTIKLIEV